MGLVLYGYYAILNIAKHSAKADAFDSGGLQLRAGSLKTARSITPSWQPAQY